MIKLGTSGRTRQLALVQASPLRRADPRTKLALCLCASLAVMLPLERLAAFMVIYTVLLLWARLLPEAARQVWRLKWVLASISGAPVGFVALGLVRAVVGYIVFGALGGMLGGLTLAALRRAGFFTYLAEKR